MIEYGKVIVFFVMVVILVIGLLKLGFRDFIEKKKKILFVIYILNNSDEIFVGFLDWLKFGVWKKINEKKIYKIFI